MRFVDELIYFDDPVGIELNLFIGLILITVHLCREDQFRDLRLMFVDLVTVLHVSNVDMLIPFIEIF